MTRGAYGDNGLNTEERRKGRTNGGGCRLADRTGLSGKYDLRLSFAPDLRDTDRPTVFAALEEQLGLRLEPARGPVETIVIVSAKPPTDN